jgi:hypothetical protein
MNETKPTLVTEAGGTEIKRSNVAAGNGPTSSPP